MEVLVEKRRANALLFYARS